MLESVVAFRFLCKLNLSNNTFIILNNRLSNSLDFGILTDSGSDHGPSAAPATESISLPRRNGKDWIGGRK